MDDQSKPARWGKFSDAAEAELPEYRALSGLAVVGFLLALFSALAIVHISLSFIGAAAALCCLAALVRISASPSEISGRRLALAGLVLAIFWTTSGLAKDLTRQRLLDVHSRAFAVHWFEYLKNGEPEKAFELRSLASVRRPLDSKLLSRYLSSRNDYEALEEFVTKPAVRALLTLGDRAQVRHYTFNGAVADDVSQVFAVTYDDHGTKKSFLVHMTLLRSNFPDHGVSAWRINGSHAPWTPDARS